MAVSYNKLWKILIDKKMKKIDFRDQSGLTTNVLAKLGKDEHVSTQTLEKYVNCLNAKLEIFWSMFQMKVGIHKWDRM